MKIFIFDFSSGTGKSTLLKKIVGTLRETKTVYLVHVKTEEVKTYRGRKKDILVTTVGGAKKAKKNSCIFVEDVINLEKEEEIKLRTLLNYDGHHKSLRIFCVAHTITKNGIFGMLSLFHYLVFTSSASNIPVLRNCLRYFKIEVDEIEKWIKQFKLLGGKNRSHYFFFNCNQMKFYFARNIFNPKTYQLIGNGGSEEDELGGELSEEQTRKLIIRKLEVKFEKLIESEPLKTQAMSVFDMIINCINVKQVSEADLSLSFLSSKLSSSSKKISLVDYIMTLLVPNKTVNRDLQVVHNYIGSLCVIPKIFVKNNNFVNVRE